MIYCLTNTQTYKASISEEELYGSESDADSGAGPTRAARIAETNKVIPKFNPNRHPCAKPNPNPNFHPCPTPNPNPKPKPTFT